MVGKKERETLKWGQLDNLRKTNSLPDGIQDEALKQKFNIIKEAFDDLIEVSTMTQKNLETMSEDLNKLATATQMTDEALSQATSGRFREYFKRIADSLGSVRKRIGERTGIFHNMKNRIYKTK